MDALRGDGEDDADDTDAAFANVAYFPSRSVVDRSHVFGVSRDRSPRLFTATLVWSDGTEVMHAFHASIGASVREIRMRLVERFGFPIAEGAEVSEGFRNDTAFVEAMVSPAIRDMLCMVAREPASPLAAGLDLNVEQRFLN